MIFTRLFTFRFEQLLSQEILLNCFDSEFESILHKYCPDCYIEAIELCTALMRSQYMLNLMCGLRGSNTNMSYVIYYPSKTNHFILFFYKEDLLTYKNLLQYIHIDSVQHEIQ